MSAGKTLAEALSRQLGPHMEWDEVELVTLGMIEAATDRLAVLRSRFGVAAADSDTSASALASLAAECRLSEATIAKWAASLDPHDEVAVSQRHRRGESALASGQWHVASIAPRRR